MGWHATVSLNRKLYVFGGVYEGLYTNRLVCLNTVGKHFLWQQPVVKGSIPCARAGHTLTVVGKRNCYLIGGRDASGNCLSDVYFFHTGATDDVLIWNKVNSSGDIPPPMHGHAAVAIDRQLVIFGGSLQDGTQSQDLYILNTSSLQWSRIALGGAVPSPRYGHTMNVLGDKIMVFGGMSEGDLKNDFYYLNLETMAWEQVEASSTAPPARMFHAADVVSNKLFIYGGKSEDSGSMSDCYCFDAENRTWTHGDLKTPGPKSRFAHTFTTMNAWVYVIGGFDLSGVSLTRVHALFVVGWYRNLLKGPTTETETVQPSGSTIKKSLRSESPSIRLHAQMDALTSTPGSKAELSWRPSSASKSARKRVNPSSPQLTQRQLAQRFPGASPSQSATPKHGASPTPISVLEMQLAKERSRNALLKKEVEFLQESKRNNKANELQERLEALEVEHHSQTAALEGRIKDLLVEVVAWESRTEKTKKEMREKLSEMDSIQSTLSEVKNENQQLAQSVVMAEEASLQVGTMKATVESLGTEVEQLKNKLAITEKENEQLRKETHKLNVEMLKKKARDSLSRQLELEETLERKNAVIQNLQNDFMQAEDVSEEAEEVDSQSSLEVQAHQRAVRRARQLELELEKLREELNTIGSRHTPGVNGPDDKLIHQQQLEIDALNSVVKESKMQLRISQESCAKMQRELAIVRRQASELRSEAVNEHVADMASFEEAQTLRTENLRLQSLLSESRSKIESMQRAVDEADVAAQINEVDRLKTNLKSTQARLAALHQEKMDLEDELNVHRQDGLGNVLKAEHSLARLERESQELRTELRQLAESKTQSDRRVKELEAKVSEWELDENADREELRGKTEMLAKQKRVNRQLEEQVAELQLQLDAKSRNSGDQDGASGRAEFSAGEESSRAQAAEHEVDRLQRALQDTVRDLEVREGRLTSLEEQNIMLREKLQDSQEKVIALMTGAAAAPSPPMPPNAGGPRAPPPPPPGKMSTPSAVSRQRPQQGQQESPASSPSMAGQAELLMAITRGVKLRRTRRMEEEGIVASQSESEPAQVSNSGSIIDELRKKQASKQ